MKLNREKVVPHLRQNAEVSLYTTTGHTYTIKEFVQKYLKLLSAHEGLYIKKHINEFNYTIPDFLSKPLVSVKPDSSNKGIVVKSIGSRSAFWPVKKLKFKGCRPKPDLYFPHEQLNFGEKKTTTTKIIFGVLSAENVMREILASCFFMENKLSIFQKPYAIFEYEHKNKIIGYCLIFSSPAEERLESKEYYDDLNIKDLIITSHLEKRFKIDILNNREAVFRGIDPKWYAEKKSELLIKMNFGGGFRGILNSNLGNDIVYNKKFYICDFDTFKVIEIPEKPSKQFIKNFCLWCIAELLKTSPLVLDYVDIEGLTDKQAVSRIWNAYINGSSLYKACIKKFIKHIKTRKWSIRIVNEAIKEAVKAQAVRTLILDNCINSKTLMTTYKPELSFYIPHNYNK